jgi:glycosyltransferase involved in cell wall biosynthesis
MNGKRKVLVDGRVFSTAAFDRGMGRYVGHLLTLLEAEGHSVTLLLFRNVFLSKNDDILKRYEVRFANFDPEMTLPTPELLRQELHQFSAHLTQLLEDDNFDVYVDATPFLGPLRLDVFACSVVSVCYDFIPLKHPDYYLGGEVSRMIYHNGLARVAKADAVICISETTAEEARLYLGVPPERLSTIYPDLDDYYLTQQERTPRGSERPHMFTILGFHKSKNPINSAKLYNEFSKLNAFDLLVNAPKADQMRLIQAQVTLPRTAKMTSDITEKEKHKLQGEALFIAHLSTEEGFGIPFLEALFLGRKTIALDIPINREITSKSSVDLSGSVYYIPADADQIDVASFQKFLRAPSNPDFFNDIRSVFSGHWRDSKKRTSEALDTAENNYRVWCENLIAKTFSSIPGTMCGVADYTIAYIRSTQSNIVLFFSMGEYEQVAFLKNVKLASHLDFERFSIGKFAGIKGIYNLAFSDALAPGIYFMNSFAKTGDAIMLHERQYFDGGLLPLLGSQNKTDEFFQKRYAGGVDKTTAAKDRAFQPSLNRHAPRSDWLRVLGARIISHLPPSVMAKVEAEQINIGRKVNDFDGIEDVIEYIPLGIDDRAHPAVARAARVLRIERGLAPNDILVGHFGLIIDDLKRLGDAVRGFLRFASRLRDDGDPRSVVFALVGKIIDQEFFASIRRQFSDLGLENRLIHQMPCLERHFDVEIAACDAVFCMRRQWRGQLSHVFVRALALGVPVIVNRDSGYGYDPATTVDDDDIDRSISDVLFNVLDRRKLEKMRSLARNHYDAVHRGDKSLISILKV